MEKSTRHSLAVAAPAGQLLSLLVVWSAVGSSSAAATATAKVAAAAPMPVPVRVGVVLDLTSKPGRESLTCISMALDEFYLKHPSCTTRVELRIRDSRGEALAAERAAEDLIKNAQVQAIIWGPQTSTAAEFVAHLVRRSRIPVLSFTGIYPTSCVFWLEDSATGSGDRDTIGFTLGNDTITFLGPENDGRNARKLETRKQGEHCRGPALKIAVPLKLGFQSFVNVTHPNSDRQNVTGYCIDVFETAVANLQPRPCYRFYVFHGPYDELVGNVTSGVYDGAVGDVTITTERVTGTDFTMPYTQSGVSMLVLAEETIQWTFVKPLSRELWSATVCFFFYIAFVVWMIERPRNQEFQGSSLRQFCTASYFSFSTLTFSHGQIIKSPLAKIVVVVWCFVVLILVQSYTASFSSILTAKRLQPSVKDLNQLRQSGGFVGYQDESFVRTILINHGFRESRLRNYTNKEEYADALRKGSKNGGVSAIVDEIPYLTSFLSDHRFQNDFKMVGSIYKTPGFGFAFRLGSPLVHNLSTAILNLTGGDEGSEMETKWFGAAQLPVGDGTVPDTDSAPLTLQSFSGLFVITGSISTLMLLISIVKLFHATCTEARKANAPTVNDGGGDEDSHPLQNGTADDSVPEQPLRVAVNNDSQGVHRSYENAGDEEPGPERQNGMHSGSVPAESVHIEMSNV